MAAIAPLRWLYFIRLDAQSVMYGGFAVLMPIAMFIFIRNGIKNVSRTVIFAMTFAAFTLCTGSWITEVITLTLKLLVYPSNPFLHVASILRLNLQTFGLLNLIFADGVLVWRMRTLYGSHFSSRTLLVPTTSLVITSVAVCLALGLQVFSTILMTRELLLGRALRTTMNVLHVVSWISSLTTALTATMMTARWMWLSWTTILGIFRAGGLLGQIRHVLVLLVESGVIYCISSSIVTSGIFFHSLFGCTWADVWIPVHIQLAGMYPALTILIVGTQPSTLSLGSSITDAGDKLLKDTTNTIKDVSSSVISIGDQLVSSANNIASVTDVGTSVAIIGAKVADNAASSLKDIGGHIAEASRDIVVGDTVSTVVDIGSSVASIGNKKVGDPVSKIASTIIPPVINPSGTVMTGGPLQGLGAQIKTPFTQDSENGNNGSFMRDFKQGIAFSVGKGLETGIGLVSER